uniref:SCP domain-containing protein n=1 Tax=Oryza punctata TaxID=4537 RepID=A0A0E0LGY8_ORYPU
MATSCLLVAAVLVVAMAAATPPCTAQDFVDPHNAARSDIGVGAVTWDDTVAAYAESYAEQRRGDCALQHSDSGGKYGENIFWGPAGGDWTAASVEIRSYAEQRRGDCALQHSDSGGKYGENIFWGSAGGDWTAERRGVWYDHGSNSCSAPADQSCGHYTQVVWRDSTAIGCARVVCDNNLGVFITCNYSPPGNVVGQSPY